MIMPLPARQGHCVTAIRPNGDLLFVEVCSDATPMQRSTGQGRIASRLFSASKQAHSRHCVTATRPMEISSSYTCAVMQHQCTAALVRAE